MGWTLHWAPEVTNVSVSNIHVIHTGNYGDQVQSDEMNSALINTNNNGTGSHRGYRFENITVEGSLLRLLLIRLQPPKHTYPHVNISLSDVTLRNINVYGLVTAQWTRNLVRG